MRVKSVKLDHFAGPTAASGSFEISGDFRDDVSRAVREDHFCDDSSCDIREAWENGYPFIAAYLLYGATECPALDAVRFAYSLRADGIPVDFVGADLRDLPDAAEWFAHFERYGYECDSCGSFTFGSDYWTPEECGNCGATLETSTEDES